MNVPEHATQNYLDILNVYERLRTTEMDSAGSKFESQGAHKTGTSDFSGV